MKKVLSIAAMLIFVAGFAMAQNPTTQTSTKPVANKEAKADNSKKSHKGAKAKHIGKKTAATKSSTTKATGTSEHNKM